MKFTVFYTVPQVREMEITEDMIRDLYNKYHDIDKVFEALDWYIQKQSGYVDDDGRDFEFLEDECDIEDWVYEVIKKNKRRGKITSSRAARRRPDRADHFTTFGWRLSSIFFEKINKKFFKKVLYIKIGML